MGVAVITGSSGLIGSEAALHFAGLGLDIVGVDNDMRQVFFGAEASTAWNRRAPGGDARATATRTATLDIRDRDGARRAASAATARDRARHPHRRAAVARLGGQRAARRLRHQRRRHAQRARGHAPVTARMRCSSSPRRTRSTATRPNTLPLVELETRWEIDPGPHVRRTASARTCRSTPRLHSVFGASKVAADVMVQEYGRYFGMRTACFRGGTLTGPNHSAAELHGFLAYVMRCTMTGTPYTVYGYKGKQVRDAIHSHDLIRAFDEFFHAPRVGRGLQHRRRALQQLLRARGDRALRRRSSGESSSGRTRTRTGSATTSGGSATTAASSRTIPDWQLEYDVPKHPRGDQRSERRALATGKAPARRSDRLVAGRGPRSRRLKVLISTSYYWPEEAGSAPYLTGLAEHLSAEGHKVVVATGFAHYPDWRSGAHGKLAATESQNGVEIVRRWHYVPHSQSALQRGLYELSLLGFGATTVFRRWRPDVVVGTCPSLAGGMLAAAAARRYRVPYGIVFQDLMGRAAEQSGVSGGARVAGLVKRGELRVARGANAVGIIARDLQGLPGGRRGSTRRDLAAPKLDAPRRAGRAAHTNERAPRLVRRLLRLRARGEHGPEAGPRQPAGHGGPPQRQRTHRPRGRRERPPAPRRAGRRTRSDQRRLHRHASPGRVGRRRSRPPTS